MEAQLSVGPSTPLHAFWQQQEPDQETKMLYANARGRGFCVGFPTRPQALACVVFRNFYAASLRLVQRNFDGSTLVLLDDYPLMKHAHCEDDAQQWHVIHLDRLRVKPDLSRLDWLLVYLFQPSPLFETWELQHLKIYESRSTSKAETADDQQSAPDLHHQNITTSSTSTTVAAASVQKPFVHELMHLLSRSSLIVVDARDVRENATQLLSQVHQLRQLVHHANP